MTFVCRVKDMDDRSAGSTRLSTISIMVVEHIRVLLLSMLANLSVDVEEGA